MAVSGSIGALHTNASAAFRWTPATDHSNEGTDGPHADRGVPSVSSERADLEILVEGESQKTISIRSVKTSASSIVGSPEGLTMYCRSGFRLKKGVSWSLW